jgi:peptide/nickel transport system permease protein
LYKFVGKRLLLLIPTILGVTFIVFSIMSLTPGDPGRLILGQNAPQEAVNQLNAQLGYDRPFLIRFGNYVFNAIRGDFGTSYRTSRPVFEAIFIRFPTTAKLAFSGVILSVLIGIPLGILSAVKQYSAMDMISTVSAMFMAAIPGFWLGLMLIIVFSLRLGWLPSNGIGSVRHYILPAVTVAIPGAAGILRLTRTTMLETIRSDYVRTARAKGALERTIIWKHSLRNALLPIITVIGMSFAGALGGSVLTESVYSMPGLGTLVVTAIRTKDIPQVLAAVLFLSFLFMVIMLVVDLLYGYADPRIRSMYGR